MFPMSKKDYQLIANALLAVQHQYGGNNGVITDVAHYLSDALASDNPRFNKATFLTACGVAVG